MRSTPWLAALLCACASGEPAPNDLESTRSGLNARIGLDAALGDDSLDPALAPELLPLLQAPLTEDAAVRIALCNNRDVRAGLARLGIARADLVQAGLLRNPVFDGMARFFFDGGTEVELGLAVPFVDLFHRPLRERLAGHELAAAQAVVTHELVHLTFAVRRAFVGAHAAQQLVALQTKALAAATAARELITELHTAGNTTDRALAAERLAEVRARLDLAAAEQALIEAREPLQALLGLWGPHTQWTLAGELPAEPLAGVDLDHVEARCIAASLELLEQRARIEALAQHADLTSWQRWLPDGHAGVGAQRDAGGGWGLGPAVQLEVPLLDRGEARLARSEAALREGLQHQVQLAVEIRSAARLLHDRLTALAARLQFQRSAQLPLREQLVRATVQHYNAMQIGAFDVLQARQQQLADEVEALTTRRQALDARLDLQELLAGSMPRAALAPSWPATGRSATTPNRGH